MYFLNDIHVFPFLHKKTLLKWMKEKKVKIKTLISLSRRKCTFLCFLMLIYANTNDMQIFATKNRKICKPLQRKLRNIIYTLLEINFNGEEAWGHFLKKLKLQSCNGEIFWNCVNFNSHLHYTTVSYGYCFKVKLA